MYPPVEMAICAGLISFLKFAVVSSKYLVTGIVSFCFVFSLVVIGMSFGVHLMIFLIVLVPALIMQVYAGIKSYKKHPEYTLWILLSSFAFLGFCLFRPDTDQYGPFNGYTALMYYLGASETKQLQPWAYSLEVALLLILVQVFINTYILRGFGKIPW